jgi:hypothetical protein
MFTMPRKRLNSEGTFLLGAGSSIDSMMNVTTICFCSRVIPFSSAIYGAIGVSLILCAIAVIILNLWFWLQGRCKPNAMELAPIAEAQPVGFAFVQRDSANHASMLALAASSVLARFRVQK